MELGEPVVIHVISSLGAGGAQTTLDKICGIPSLAKTIVFPLKNEEIPTQRENLSPRNVVSNPTPLSWNSIRRTIWNLKKIIEYRNPSIVYAWMYHAMLIVFLSTFWSSNRPKVVWMIRQARPLSASRNPLTLLLIAFTGLIARAAADRIVYVSHEAAQFHEKVLGYPRSRRFILLNPSPSLHMAPRNHARYPNGLIFPQDGLTLGVITRPGKRVKWSSLLGSAKRLEKRFGALPRILVLGIEDFPSKFWNWRYAAQNIHFRPWTPETSAFMESIDIMIHPTVADGMSNTILECVNSMTPVIALDSAINKKITNESPWLVRKISGHTILKSVEKILILRASGQLNGILSDAAVSMSTTFHFDRFALEYRRLFLELT